MIMRPLLLLLASVFVLSSCGTHRSMPGVSIEKRKYSSGWYVHISTYPGSKPDTSTLVQNEITENVPMLPSEADSTLCETFPVSDTALIVGNSLPIADHIIRKDIFISIQKEIDATDNNFNRVNSEQQNSEWDAAKTDDPTLMILGIFFSMLLSACALGIGLFLGSSIMLLVMMAILSFIGLIAAMYFAKRYDDYAHIEPMPEASANPFSLISIILCVIGGIMFSQSTGVGALMLIVALIFSIIALIVRANNPSKFKDTWLALFPFILAGAGLFFAGFVLFITSAVN